MYIEGYENPEVASLTRAGKHFFLDPPDAYRDAPLLHPRGGLTIAGPGEEARLHQYLDTWQPLCPELAAIDAAECARHVPLLRDEWIRAGAYDPAWSGIDVHELLMLYQRGLKDRGAVVQTGARVSGLCRHKAAWVIALGERGSGDSSSIEADIVVNAAGAWAGSIGKLAGASPVTLTPMRRSAAIIPAPENADAWPLVHTINEELYFKPESPGLMICPQDETPSEPMDAFPDEIDIAIAADRFTHIVDHSFSQVLHRWAGLRTFAPDRRPVVGFDQNAQGFFWLAGQGGFGVQTSPGLGQLTAQAIHTGTSIETRINVTRFAR